MSCVHFEGGQSSGEAQTSEVTNNVDDNYEALLMNHYPGYVGESSDKPPPLVRDSQAGPMKPLVWSLVCNFLSLLRWSTMTAWRCQTDHQTVLSNRRVVARVVAVEMTVDIKPERPRI
jgi:hypothetical protein